MKHPSRKVRLGSTGVRRFGRSLSPHQNLRGQLVLGHTKLDNTLVNVTDTLKKLKRGGVVSTDEPLSVQLVAVPVTRQFIRPEMQLMLKDIDLIVSPVSVHSKYGSSPPQPHPRMLHQCIRDSPPNPREGVSRREPQTGAFLKKKPSHRVTR